MALSRVTLAITLIVVLVGSTFAQGPVTAPSPAPTTTTVAQAPTPMVVAPTPSSVPALVPSPMEAPPMPPAQTPTMSTDPPPAADSPVDDSTPASVPGPSTDDGGHSEGDGHDHDSAFLHGSSLALIGVLGAVAVFA